MTTEGAVIALVAKGEKRRDVDAQGPGRPRLESQRRKVALPLGMDREKDVLHAFARDEETQPRPALVVVQLEVVVADVGDRHDQVDPLVEQKVAALRLRADLHLGPGAGNHGEKQRIAAKRPRRIIV